MPTKKLTPTRARAAIKALTIQQPYATDILTGRKPKEYRPWELKDKWLDVPIALHAAKQSLSKSMKQEMVDGGEDPNDFPLGAIIGVITFDRVSWSKRFDRYAFRIGRVRRLPKPIPCSGQLGLWNLTPQQLRAIARQLA
jgi:hypothetical protein